MSLKKVIITDEEKAVQHKREFGWNEEIDLPSKGTILDCAEDMANKIIDLEIGREATQEDEDKQFLKTLTKTIKKYGEEDQEEPLPLPKIFSLKEGIEKGVPPMTWLIHNIIPERAITMLAAPPKSYKSFLAMEMGLSCAYGDAFLGKYPTKKCNTLYIDEENGKATMIRRFGLLTKNRPIEPLDDYYVTCTTGLKLDEETHRKVLINIIQEHEIKLVILDSLVRFMRGDEDRSSDVRKLFETMKIVMEQTNCSFLILHHLRKSNGRKRDMESLRGSSDLAAMVDVILTLKPNTKNPAVIMDWFANRHVDIHELEESLVLINSGDEELSFKYQGEIKQVTTKVDEYANVLVEWFRKNEVEEFRTSDAAKILGKKGMTSTDYMYEAFELLKSRNELSKKGYGKWGVIGNFIQSNTEHSGVELESLESDGEKEVFKDEKKDSKDELESLESKGGNVEEVGKVSSNFPTFQTHYSKEKVGKLGYSKVWDDVLKPKLEVEGCVKEKTLVEMVKDRFDISDDVVYKILDDKHNEKVIMKDKKDGKAWRLV